MLFQKCEVRSTLAQMKWSGSEIIPTDFVRENGESSMSEDAFVPAHDRRETISDKTMDELMHQSYYTPVELAKLLDVPLTVIEHDAYAHKLKAYIVEHNIISIRREDALAWMNDRG